MSSSVDLLAIIPARGGSKGIPGKNIKPLHGRPLIQYTIDAALQSKYVQHTIVSTDDEQIAAISREAGASVPSLRPAHLATDEARTIDVIQYEIEKYELEWGCIVSHIMLLQPTSPLRNSEDIDLAYQIYLDKRADSVQSVTAAVVHPYILRKIEHDKLVPYQDGSDPNMRRQDVDALYQLNGAIYIVGRDVLMKKHSFVGSNNYPYVMPAERSIDIDHLIDFRLAEILLQE